MTIDITLNIPSLDHLAQVLEGRDLAVLVDNFHRELDERLDAMAQNRVEAATAPAPTEKPAEASVSAPAPTPTDEPVKSAAKAPDTAPAARQDAKPAPAPAPKEEGPKVDMAAIRKASAALRDAGKLLNIQDLLQKHGVKNLSSLKPDQLDSFAAGLRDLGAKI